MNNFTSNKIQQNNELIAEEIKQKRLDKKIKLEVVAKTLKINIRYLQALENGQLEKLPAGLYGKKILREYALFLGLDADFLEKVWELETENRQKEHQQNIFSYKVPKMTYFLTLPGLIKNFLIIFSVTICLFYLGYYIRNIIRAPRLEIYSPIENSIISENYIKISGQTDPETNVTINEKTILLDTQGNFNEKINLSNGLNTVSIVAQKKYSKENRLIRHILVKVPDQDFQLPTQP